MDTLQARFFSAKKLSKAFIRNIKNPQERRRLEEESCYHIKHITDYGFLFFPKQYIIDSIKWLESLK